MVFYFDNPPNKPVAFSVREESDDVELFVVDDAELLFVLWPLSFPVSKFVALSLRVDRSCANATWSNELLTSDAVNTNDRTKLAITKIFFIFFHIVMFIMVYNRYNIEHVIKDIPSRYQSEKFSNSKNNLPFPFSVRPNH